ncbi:YbaB/EbfC family nucleoid-associated protein [Pasteuria penetrans]|uniref:YbaB/EbfC family nucleoid-associated protein n=1 Tax=Pasteuria penetrans TaxID=86005 RepID=UPI001FE6FEE4|nr:YbaB/EbfC family nucleoid-associated protein [Pasteuria penetrans]
MRGGMPNQQQMIKNLQKMQSEMERVQENLKGKEVEASAGGGAVKLCMDGHKRVRSVTISPEVMKAGDSGMLEDLMVTAFNTASDMADEMARKDMEGVTQGMPLPPGFL